MLALQLFGALGVRLCLGRGKGENNDYPPPPIICQTLWEETQFANKILQFCNTSQTRIAKMGFSFQSIEMFILFSYVNKFYRSASIYSSDVILAKNPSGFTFNFLQRSEFAKDGFQKTELFCGDADNFLHNNNRS